MCTIIIWFYQRIFPTEHLVNHTRLCKWLYKSLHTLLHRWLQRLPYKWLYIDYSHYHTHEYTNSYTNYYTNDYANNDCEDDDVLCMLLCEMPYKGTYNELIRCWRFWTPDRENDWQPRMYTVVLICVRDCTSLLLLTHVSYPRWKLIDGWMVKEWCIYKVKEGGVHAAKSFKLRQETTKCVDIRIKESLFCSIVWGNQLSVLQFTDNTRNLES